MQLTSKDYYAARVVALIIGTTVLLVALGCGAADVHARSAAASRAVKHERVKISIEGMHCTSCAHGIQAMLKWSAGLKSAV